MVKASSTSLITTSDGNFTLIGNFSTLMFPPSAAADTLMSASLNELVDESVL